jgi:hypothetical protein
MSGNMKIILEDKEYVLEKIHISELNYLMVRLFNPIEKKYTTYNLGNYDPENNFIKDEIEKRIKGDSSSK